MSRSGKELFAGPPEVIWRDAVEQLDGPAVRALMKWADAARPSVGLGSESWASHLARLTPGEPHPLPAAAIRPGQTQISFDLVAVKARELAQRLDESPDPIHALFRPDDFPIVVGPAGAFAILRDGHHKFAGLLALSILAATLAGVAPGPDTGVDPRWRRFMERIPAPEDLAVLAWVDGQEADLAEDAPTTGRLEAFFALFEDPRRYRPPLYLALREGGEAPHPPDRFSALQDNPFRQWAANLVARFRWGEDGALKLKASDRPLWLKGPDAPDYVEFHVAEVIEATARTLGLTKAPTAVVPEALRTASRAALLRAQRDGHPVLRKVIAFEHDLSGADLRASVELAAHAVMSFGRSELRLRNEEVPVILVPAEAPEAHHLHAAVRLHGALVAAGADLHADALSPAIARDAIRRLEWVPDEVGLWLNLRGVTAGELRRDAAVAAAAAALEIERNRKGQLVPKGVPPEHPLFIALPDQPTFTNYAIGDLWADLLEAIGHDPDRFETVVEEARRRLVEARTDPRHPFYLRLESLPVIVSGDAHDVAASLRIGRKRGHLETGHPVPGARVAPHVLGPRIQRPVPL